MKQKKFELTPEEEILILEKRRQEELNKPRKIGFLKEDIYEYNPPVGIGLWTFFSESEKNTKIETFKNCFKKTLSAGSEFLCYIEDEQDCWYDNCNYGYECLNSDWAKENLINIRDIK